MPLSDYGHANCSYQGEGTLHLRTGTPGACSFQAGQLSNGEVLLLAASPLHTWGSDEADRFTGRTTNGSVVDATLDSPLNVLGREPSLPAGTYFAYRALALRIDTQPASSVGRPAGPKR